MVDALAVVVSFILACRSKTDPSGTPRPEGSAPDQQAP